MKTLLLSLILLIGLQAYGQDAQYYYSEGKKAFEQKDYAKAYDQYKEANKLYPYSSRLNYQLGLSAAMSGHSAEAIASLKKAIEVNADFELQNKEELASLKGNKEWEALIASQKTLQTPIIHSDTAFVLKDRALHIESIAYDPSSKSFFVGSIHKSKIVKIDSHGAVTDFIPSGDNGIASVFGIKADAKNKVLWASSSPMPEMENYDSTRPSGVYKYNLATGKLLTKYALIYKAKDFVLGDLTLNSKGEVFISDSKNNVLFKVNESSKALDEYFTSEEFISIQGISFSEDDKYLFIADYVKGIYRLEVSTKKLIRLESSFGQSLAGVDGLTFYKNTLIAVQNGVTPLRVTQYHLNAAMDKLEKFTILDRKHPAFSEPTSGILAGNQFYYIANSQWGGYDDNHQIKPTDQLQDIVILKYSLKAK